ncbi:unnamed protein product [Prunus armeniaca]|uniref:Uncharacterized protein n=1 Tax=Prunus armeniaca TaxID=36596 RepID=A0A6J5UJF3_PRUAR|nr:unnamed protein product [Prunus armeniaca]
MEVWQQPTPEQVFCSSTALPRLSHMDKHPVGGGTHSLGTLWPVEFALSVVTVFGNVLKYLELTVLNGKVGDYDITCQQLCFWGLGGLVASDVELGLEVAARAYAKGIWD